jgi:hypothetical protein
LRVPPRIDWAKRHGAASLIGTPQSFNDKERARKAICPCCGKNSVSVSKFEGLTGFRN